MIHIQFVRFKILIFFCFLILTDFSALVAQELNVYRHGNIENKCYTYYTEDDNLFAETQNINRVSDNLNQTNRKGYIVSKPLEINLQTNSAELSFAYVIKGVNIEKLNTEFYISVSFDGITYQIPELIDAELSTDTAIYGNLYFIYNRVKFIKFILNFGNQTDKSFYENIRISIINPGLTDLNEFKSSGFSKSDMPKYISRTEWACADGQNAPLWSPQYTNVTHLVIHHTAGSNSTTQDYAATVRSIWTQHTYTNSWGDIGYNFLIDAFGKIYEGRAGGNNVIGAHCGFNSGTMGVSVMGTYTSVLPSDTALGSLMQLLAWKCNDSKINPLITLYHASTGKTISTICGHRDVKSTECPGNRFYTELEVIKNKVNTKLQENVSTKNQIKVYPLPFTETLTLDIEHINWKNFKIEIADMFGRIIKMQDVTGFEGGKIFLNLFDLKHGVYYLRIMSNSDVLYNEKIIKI